MRRNAVLAALVVAASIAGGAAAAGTVEFKGSTFESEEGGFVLLGVGNRTKIGGALNIYNAGFYVNKAEAEAALKKIIEKKPGAFSCCMKSDGTPDWEKMKGSGPFNTFMWKYAFGKKLVMKFQYSVKGEQVVGAYEETLKRTIPDFEAPDVKNAVKTFLDGVNHPVNKGQTMVVSSSGDVVSASGPFPAVKVEKNWKFRQAIWRIWFGPNPIQKPLKVGLTKFAEKLSWPKI